MSMKYLMLVSVIFFLSLSLWVSANESKSERTAPVEHTAHPPHDHPNNDHLKKLDESLRRSRNEDEEKKDD